MMERFTRQETLVLTRSSPGRLSYLARTGIVVPQKSHLPNQANLLYTWDQVLEIRAINLLRQKASFQTIRKIVNFLESYGFDKKLRDKHLVVLHDEVDWVMPDSAEIPRILRVAGKNSQKTEGQFLLMAIPPLADLIKDVWETARTSKVIDFESFKKRVNAHSDQE
ncbi:MAG: hypothetical protein QNJ46_12005 [Leptolyngbyaceae cyanobacterium MO_188.B28]|nr:hypothetical protein [Leptolyngbyaceae cyanobacterium MO_188.B28]